MAIVLKDRVKEVTSTAGTSDFVLGGSSSGYQAFSVIGANNFTYYCCFDNTTGDWEVGYGQYTTAAGGTLVRNTILSNSAATTSKISFAAGPKDVFITYPAEKAIYEEETGNVLIDGGPITVVGSGVTSYTSFTAVLGEMYGNVNSFAQFYAQNYNNGTDASGDFVVYRNDALNDAGKFVDMGINSSGYNSLSYPIFSGGSAYTFNDGGEMFFGSATDDVVFFAGGVQTTDEAMRIDKTTKALTTTGDVNVGGALDVTGAAVFGSTVLLNADPTLGLQAATKQYVDTAVSTGLHLHQPVRVATTGNLTSTYNNGTAGVGATLTNSGTQVALSVDGISVSVADRVLVWQQSAPAQNGVYVVTSVGSGSTNWVLTRSSDTNNYDPQTDTGLGGGDYFYVQEGTTGAGDSYVCTNAGTITFGTTAITFAQFSGAITYVGGTNINVSGQTISLTGTVAATNGGTGTSTVATGDLLYGSAANTWSKLTLGATYKVLVSDASGIPQWGAVALNQAAAVAGTLPTSNGGTGLSSYALGDIVYSDAANSLARLAGNTTTTKKFLGQTGTGAGSAAPVWQQPAASDITGLAASATTDTTNASNITSGTLGTARLTGSYTGITGVGTLTAGTWNAGVIGATYGGTGQSSYAVGDLLYAATTSTLGKLADVAVGNALISGGVGSAPTWGKIGAATHITGTLPTANGGTGLTGFTANGVVYASSTSALTTGSALTFDGTRLDVISASDAILGSFASTASANNTAIRFGISGNDSYINATGNSSGNLALRVYGTEIARLTSTGLGIGTSSPAYKLDVNIASGSVRVRSNTATANSAGYLLGNSYRAWSILSESSAGNFVIVDETTAGTPTRLALDSSGNLGLGVTPSAWFAGYKAIQFPLGSISNWSSTDSIEVASNAYASGSNIWTYIENYNSARYSVGQGAHKWFVAPAGTGAISFTQAMTLDASGNLGVGTTSPTFATGGGVQVKGNTFMSVRVTSSSYTGVDFSQDTSANGYVWNRDNAALIFGTNNTERARIDTGGNLLVGTTASAGARLSLQANATNGYSLWSINDATLNYSQFYFGGTSTGGYQFIRSDGRSGGWLAFGTQDTERARIDSSGNFGIGTSSPGYKLDVNGVIHNNAAVFVSQGIQGNSSGFTFSGAGSNYGRIYEAANDRWALGYSASYGGASTEVLSWNSSGNLGLGVTPSAWYSDYRAFQIGTTSAVYGRPGTNETGVTQNYYRDASAVFRYIGNGYAASYVQLSGGGHAWFNGANNVSGAGAALTLTQAMTLDASGQLMLGTTSAVAQFSLYSNNVHLQLQNSTTGTAASDGSRIYLNNSDLLLVNREAATIQFYTADTERARITSTGGFSVGTTADPGAGAIYATGNITAYYSSDARFKENIQPITGATEIVKAIGADYFDWTDAYIADHGGEDGYFVQKADFGVIAQKVQKVFPKAVRVRQDGSLAVDYEKLGVLAFAALNEQEERIARLEALVAKLTK